MITKKFLFIPVFLIPVLSKHATAVLDGYINSICTIGTSDLYQKNSLSISSVLSDLVAHSSTNSFYSSSSSVGGLGTTTYGLFYCTANVSTQDCNSCVKSAASDLKSYCSYYKGAMGFHKDCTLRYSNSTVYATPDTSGGLWIYSYLSVSYSGFNETLYATLSSLITEAAYSSKGFATGVAGLAGTRQKLRGLAQCTPDILGSPCLKCLQVALQAMPGCCNDTFYRTSRTFVATLLPSCQLRHEVSKGNPLSSPGKIVRYSLLALALVAISFL